MNQTTPNKNKINRVTAKTKNESRVIDGMTKEERKEYWNKYKATHAEELAQYQKEYREKNKTKLKSQISDWAKNHKKELREYERTPERREQQRLYGRKYRAKNPHIKILHSCRSRVRTVLKGIKKSAKTLELIGCSAEEFKKHLESKFDSNMTWENYGSYWWIDHIIPCAKFDLTKPEEQRKCFHFSNTQPMEKVANMKKSNH